MLETQVIDIASVGLGTLDGAQADTPVDQARQLTDAYLPSAAEALRRLASLAPSPAQAAGEERFYHLEEPGHDLPEELRYWLMAKDLTRLWAMVRKGQKALDEKLAEGGGDADADAVVEDLLGHVWDLKGPRDRHGEGGGGVYGRRRTVARHARALRALTHPASHYSMRMSASRCAARLSRCGRGPLGIC